MHLLSRKNLIQHKNCILLGVLVVSLCCLFLLDIALGSVAIHPIRILSGDLTPSEQIILTAYRLPKAIVALLAGAGLAIAGLQMQSFFQNDLAGPYVLGISSGASIMVALVMMGGAALGVNTHVFSTNVAAFVGAGGVLLLIIFFSKWLRSKASLLIVGLMISFLIGALLTLVQAFSGASAIQRYVFWGMGSFANKSWLEIGILVISISLGLTLLLANLKGLNALALGERIAQSMGVQMRTIKWLVIISCCLLAGSVTAFCGPIAFIGMSVPHMVKNLLSTRNYRIMIPYTLLFGGIITLLSDIIAQAPGMSFILPINVVTSLIGAPVVILLLIKRGSIHEG